MNKKTVREWEHSEFHPRGGNLVYLVHLVCLVCLVCLVQQDERDKTDARTE